MLGQKTQLAGFVLKTEWYEYSPWGKLKRTPPTSGLGVLQKVGGCVRGTLAIQQALDPSLWACSFLTLLPTPPWPRSKMVVLALGLPMTHLKQSQGYRPSPRGPGGAGEGRQGRQSWQGTAPRCPGSFC